ncbi:D-xylose-proton symporter [compost metagenome]
MWGLLGGVFPSPIWARALGFAAAAQWIAYFLLTSCFPVMAGSSLLLTYATYAIFAAASYFFVKFRVPETKGMSLEQAETLFAPTGARRSLAPVPR